MIALYGSFSLSLPCAKSSTHHLWLGWLKCSCCLSCLVVILGARLPCSFQKSTTTTTKSKANLLCAIAPTVTSFVGLYTEYTLNMLRKMSLLGTKCSPSYKHSLVTSVNDLEIEIHSSDCSWILLSNAKRTLEFKLCF